MRRTIEFQCMSQLIPFGELYIVIHRKTFSLYHNTSVYLDTQDSSSWDRNLADYSQSGILRHSQCWWRKFFVQLFTYMLSVIWNTQNLKWEKQRGRFLSFRIFGLMPTSLFLHSPRFDLYDHRLSSGVSRSREPTLNFEQRLLLNSRGSFVPIRLTITGCKC